MPKKKNYTSGYGNFLFYRSCGCCFVELPFYSIYGLKEAVKKAGVGAEKTIKDGKDNSHLFIDTRNVWSEDYRKDGIYWKHHDMEEELK